MPGGHTGPVGTFSLVPQVVETAGDTVIAAGGSALRRAGRRRAGDGRAGVWLGTAWLATREYPTRRCC